MANDTQIKEEPRAAEVQEIIGKMPSWIIERGTVVIALIVLLLFIGAWFIKYPDVVSGSVTIVSDNPPVKLVTQAAGRIQELYINDGDSVEAGRLVAIIENSADTKDMLYLKEMVERLDSAVDIRKAVRSTFLARNMQVGEMQQDYALLYEAMNNYHFFYNNDYYSKKLNNIRTQQQAGNSIDKNILERDRMVAGQLQLEAWKDSVNRKLLADKIISISEYNEIRKTYLARSINSSDNLTTLLEARRQNTEYEKSISDIEHQYSTGAKDVFLAVKDMVKKIKGEIAVWEKRYVLRSPVSGKVVFFRIRKANQYVGAGIPVFIVVPAAGDYEITAQLPVYKAGKIRTGQKVLIKLNEYPFEEFGMLTAHVKECSNIALDSFYTVKLQLDKGLHTTLNMDIDPRPELNGIADIVTSDKSILQRIFETAYGKVYQ